MLSIYICEDNLGQLRYYKKLINNIILMEEYEMKLQAAVTNPRKLLNIAVAKQEREKVGGFYLLDLELNSDMDGFALAKEIRKFDPRAFIVFITTHSEMTLLTFQYQIEAMDFILKDESWNVTSRIRSCLIAAQNRYYIAPQISMIAFKSGTHTIQMEQNTILYITAAEVSHKIQVVTDHGVREFYGTLRSCAKLLDSNFIRCHKATLVNIKHVVGVDRKTCTLTFFNGQTCFASTRGILLVMDALNPNRKEENQQQDKNMEAAVGTEEPAIPKDKQTLEQKKPSEQKQSLEQIQPLNGNQIEK